MKDTKPFICEFGHKQVNKCRQGHPTYAHPTIDNWCCACDADQAFMEAEIERRVVEAQTEARETEYGIALSYMEGWKYRDDYKKNFQLRAPKRGEKA